jgi:tetratricopeptide (TPR) repeat protein
MTPRRIAIAALLMLVVSAAFGQETKPPTLSQMMDELRKSADSYPPHIANDEERRKVEALWRKLEVGLTEFVATLEKPDPNAQLLLGDIYRMGHNLDMPGAGRRAIIHLQRAIEMNPSSARAHDLLGRHYTFMNRPADGLPELLLAYALGNEAEREYTTWSLAHNYFMQKNWPLALAFADRFAAKHPGVEAIELIRTMSRKAIETGEAPKMIESVKPE